MTEIDDNSVDLIFTDLPYGQVSCEWDKKIDFPAMWEQFMRIKKLNAPIFFCCSTKFGAEIINSAPKKCPFRYDIVWVKSAPAGFLCAKKMPMRKHEMLYVFYEKLPFYDLSSHSHKFIKEVPNEDYENRDKKTRDTIKKEEVFGKSYLEKKVNFRKFDPTLGGTGAPSHLYDPPLPVSVVKEGCGLNKGGLYSGSSIEDSGIKTTTYDPPLPHSILEIKSQRGKHATQKPTELMKWVLKYYSKEGDVVLDPTMGSGSTGVACKEMNRNFIGIEMDPEIFEVAQNRLEIS
jgi:DNA modification methylase